MFSKTKFTALIALAGAPVATAEQLVKANEELAAQKISAVKIVAAADEEQAEAEAIAAAQAQNEATAALNATVADLQAQLAAAIEANAATAATIATLTQERDAAQAEAAALGAAPGATHSAPTKEGIDDIAAAAATEDPIFDPSADYNQEAISFLAGK